MPAARFSTSTSPPTRARHGSPKLAAGRVGAYAGTVRTREAFVSVSTEGVVKGQEIRLQRPLPDFEGQRVRVVVEALGDENTSVSGADNESLWRAWVAGGPQGPIQEDEDAFPTDTGPLAGTGS